MTTTTFRRPRRFLGTGFQVDAVTAEGLTQSRNDAKLAADAHRPAGRAVRIAESSRTQAITEVHMTCVRLDSAIAAAFGGVRRRR